MYDAESQYLACLLVDPGWRRKGVGKMLVGYCREGLWKEEEKGGEQRMHVHTEQWNEAANSFYKNLGFRKICEIPNAYPGEGNGVAVLYEWFRITDSCT